MMHSWSYSSACSLLPSLLVQVNSQDTPGETLRHLFKLTGLLLCCPRSSCEGRPVTLSTPGPTVHAHPPLPSLRNELRVQSQSTPLDQLPFRLFEPKHSHTLSVAEMSVSCGIDFGTQSTVIAQVSSSCRVLPRVSFRFTCHIQTFWGMHAGGTALRGGCHSMQEP